MQESLTVVQANSLIKASYLTNPNQARIIVFICSKLNSFGEIPNGIELKIYAQEFAKFFSVDKCNIYKKLYKDCKNLQKSLVIIDGGDTEESIVWFDSVKYKKNPKEDDYILLRLGHNITPYLIALSINFTILETKYLVKMSLSYSMRFYSWLMELKGFDKNKLSKDSFFVVVELQDIKKRLMLGDKYPRWQDFKSRVIDPSVAEINQHTDLQVVYHPVKQGKSVVGVEFVCAIKNKNKKKEGDAVNSKPPRPKLRKSTKTKKGTSLDGEWQLENIKRLEKYLKELKEWKSTAKLTMADLKLLFSYYSNTGISSMREKELKNELASRTTKK